MQTSNARKFAPSKSEDGGTYLDCTFWRWWLFRAICKAKLPTLPGDRDILAQELRLISENFRKISFLLRAISNCRSYYEGGKKLTPWF